MATNDERGRIADAVRALDMSARCYWGASGFDWDMYVEELCSAIGAEGVPLNDRLADLIDPETKMAQDNPRRLEEVKAFDGIVTKCDREALLALADEMLSVSIGINSADNIRPLEAAYVLQGYARRIQKVCGVEP